jgi:hypothetical protein
MAEVFVRRSVCRTQLALGALLFLLLNASCLVAPRPFQVRVPAPTTEAPDALELADLTSGTLTAVHRSGAMTVVDLPTQRQLEFGTGQCVMLIAGPDEAGRIVFEAAGPRSWEFFPLTLFTNSLDRRALMVCSLRRGTTRELFGYRQRSYTENEVLISRRGGRVAYIYDKNLRVFDLEGRELLRRTWSHGLNQNLRISEQGDLLRFETRYVFKELPPAPEPAFSPWRTVCIEIASGEEVFAPPSKFRRTSGELLFRSERQQPDPLGALPGDLGESVFELESGLTFYEGLASPRDGARAYRSSGYSERSLRLGQRATGKTLSLVRCFEPGAWCFSDVRVDPKLLSDPASPRR